MRKCELCDEVDHSGMRYAKYSICFKCIDALSEFAVTSGMRFQHESSSV